MEKEIIKYHNIIKDELFGSVIPFWLGNAPDEINGGIYSCLDRAGRVYSTDKSVWMQGRCGWIFSYLSNLYGKNDEWLSLSKKCNDFIEKHCIDPTDGRMYFTVTDDGRPLRKRRYYFSETFAIMSHAEYFAATGDKKALDFARKYFGFCMEMYLNPSSDPYKITPKVIPETRSTRSFADNMILINVAAVLRRCDPEMTESYNKASERLINDVITYHYKPEGAMLLETVGVSGEFLKDISAGRVMNPGHTIEGSWFILNEAERIGSKELLQVAENMFSMAYERGYDAEYGGLFYFVDVLGNPPEQYEHDMKLWWVHNETMIASLALYRKTGNKKYWDIFKKTTDYCFSAFSDPQCGEWFGYLRRDSKPTEPPCKGSTYKGPFHVPRCLAMTERMLSEMINTEGNK